MRVQDFTARYPRLYHMAEAGSWPSIKKRGLLSTTASLDLLKVKGERRRSLESCHRPEKVVIEDQGLQICLRDQKPMEPKRLSSALMDGVTVQQWYEIINSKVFMWAQEHRLFGLLNARHYRALEHDVITIDAASLMRCHSEAAWLCHMNSGNTFPVPHPRGKSTFQRISEYQTKARSVLPLKEVVEVVIDYSISDVADHVVEIRRIKGDVILHPVPI